MPDAEWWALIADDEPLARRGVRQLLEAFPEFGVVRECRNGAETLAALDESNPDVIFLDIQMPGIDGFEVIQRRTPERMPAVVFLTAYDQFAIRAFEAQALDYLVKPVSEARFAATMKRLIRQLRGSKPSLRSRAIVVPTSSGSVVLHPSEVDWIQAEDNYSRVHAGARSYLLRTSLQQLEQRLRKDDFLRAHRSALVRLDGVRELKWVDEDELAVLLACGATIPVSRRRRAAFVARVRALGRSK